MIVNILCADRKDFFVYLPRNQLIKFIMRKPFLFYFCTMKDHRINRKKRHSLENIVAIAIVAII